MPVILNRKERMLIFRLWREDKVIVGRNRDREISRINNRIIRYINVMNNNI